MRAGHRPGACGASAADCRACEGMSEEDDVYSATQKPASRGIPMSKGKDRKKESKKKPAKTFDEKRAAKREKRQFRGR